MSYERRVEPLALDWRSFAWNNGVFDTARRSYTDNVEGMIRTPHHLVMVTLRGQAERLEVSSSCGHRYAGADRPGTVSFVPAHCERQLRLRGVASEWGSISLSPNLFDPDANDDEGAGGSIDISAFTNVDDPFILGMVSEFSRLSAVDGALDATYCDSMSRALAHYLVGRYGQARTPPDVVAWKLAPWRMRRVVDYVDAHLAEPMRIAELAHLVGVSPGYFHRAFRATIGKTPLEFINERRVQRAIQYLHRDDTPLAAIALRVGFISPSHFTRTFRQITGINPSKYRDGSADR
jgi:AraC family transcriptional regulator